MALWFETSENRTWRGSPSEGFYVRQAQYRPTCYVRVAMYLASLRALGRGRLADWLTSVGFSAPPALVTQSFPGYGLGLAASAPLAAHTTVLSVPSSVWRPYSADAALATLQQRAPPFAASLAALSAQLQAQRVAGADRLPQHAAMALNLLFSAGDAYVDSLPTPDVPALWPEDDQALLAGTRTAARVAARASFVSSVHAQLFGAAPPISLQAFEAALAVVVSRALTGPGAPYTLVPCLDALNHSCEPGCAHAFDAETQCFSVTTLRPHAAGEQLFISYGSLDDDRALRLYGFTGLRTRARALLAAPWDDTLAAPRLLQALLAHATPGEAVTARRQLAAAVRDAQARYPALLPDTEALLRKSDLRRRARNALTVRAGELRALADCGT